MLAISMKGKLKRFKLIDAHFEPINEVDLEMRPDSLSNNGKFAFVTFSCLQNGLIQILDVKSLHRLKYFCPFETGVLKSLSLVRSDEHRLICSNSQNQLKVVNWETSKILDSIVLDVGVLAIKHGRESLFVIDENYRLYISHPQTAIDFERIIEIEIPGHSLIEGQTWSVDLKTCYGDAFVTFNVRNVLVIYEIEKNETNFVHLQDMIRGYGVNVKYGKIFIITKRHLMVYDFKTLQVVGSRALFEAPTSLDISNLRLIVSTIGGGVLGAATKALVLGRKADKKK